MKLNLKGTKAAKYAAKQQAISALWHRGEFLDLLLNDYQKEMVAAYKASDNLLFFWLCSRRIGKTWILASLALEQALRHPGSRILFLSTTTDQISEICDQTFSPLLETCPDDLLPEYKIKQSKYIFNNGSEIRIKGLDKVGGDAIRGVKAHLIIFDEACFMKNLNETLNSVAIPMAVATKGRVLMGSTPPSTPGHDSIEIIAGCEQDNAIVKKDILAALGTQEEIAAGKKLYTQAQIDEFIYRAGGRDSSVCRREYFCEIVTEDSLAILPSFTEERVQNIVKISPKPGHNPDRYVSMDIGFRDFTVILFGYWDYARAVLVIQDEVVIRNNKATTDRIAEEVAKKERELWNGAKPHKRICDTDPRLIADLRRISGIRFTKTKKDNKEAQINQTNLMILNDQIEIHPRCTTLIAHCRYGIWNTARTQYHRTASMGHFDAIDALVYLVRNIDRSRNPDNGPEFNSDTMIWHGDQPESLDTTTAKVLNTVFSRRR